MPAVFFNALQYFATFCRALQYMVLQWLQQWVRARFLEVCSILGGLQYLQYSAGQGVALDDCSILGGLQYLQYSAGQGVALDDCSILG